MLNALTIDVEDYFHVEAFSSVIARSTWDQYVCRVDANTRRVLTVLRECSVKATFFVLGWVAERFPGLVAAIAAAGHEIATHGYGHQLVYRQTPEQFADDIQRSLAAIRAAAEVEVLGYRAPSFSITPQSQWALPTLVNAGLRYDSSIFPIAGHDLYGMPNASRFASRVLPQLVEIPVSTVRVLGKNWPVAGGGYFRFLPLWLTFWAIRRIHREARPAVVYLHPWELDPDQPRMAGASRRSRFRHYLNLHRTEPRLRQLLSRFEFAPVREVFQTELNG